MTTALRPRPMRVLGLALLVFTISFSVLAMHQVTHPGEGKQAAVAAAGHHGEHHAGSHGDPGSAPGGHDSTLLHLCLGLIVTAIGLLALHLLGWLRRDPAAALTGLRAHLVRTIPRGPPVKLFDLDTLCVLRR
ncbi:hypothetical protein N8J89_35575 [Crossiella sp. CA-258035]|uniref:hypothetical protein n=1 Tax=Crossiella sp. CA-258035 TaxID=2981138 RepID=UPI0024BC7185|nr:hypothetical protein [Crossiella sp. CA-258035]WHT18378.1 hypothetical protein N8J89_35575 [Crossiella sp. CA-258035]